MSLAMLCFPCCVDEQPPPRRRPKIDRSQIGLPTNFQHTGHIGSGEVATGFDVNQVQTSMQSKGGYEQNSVKYSTPEGIDLSHSNHKTDETSRENDGDAPDNTTSPTTTTLEQNSSSQNEITLTINSEEPPGRSS